MVHISYSGSPFTDYMPTSEENRKNVISDATKEAQSVVEVDYPYAVFRNQQEVTQFAEQIYQQWLGGLQDHLPDPDYFIERGQHYTAKDAAKNLNEWNSHLGEMKRLYISAFIGKYLENVAKKDEAAKPKITTPQPTTAPATLSSKSPLSNKATLQGVTITLKDVYHKDDECVYLLEVVDPAYIEGAHEQEWVLHLEDYTVLDTPPPTTASSFGETRSPASAIAGSDAIVLPFFQHPFLSSSKNSAQPPSGTPQQQKKVTGSFFRKPQ